VIRLPSALAEPRLPLRAIVVAWLLCVAGSLLLSAGANFLFPDLATPQFPKASAGLLLFALVAFAPFFETLILATVLEVMLRLKVPPPVAIVISSLGWGVAHSLQAPAWGLVIWWPFLIFSTLYVTWRQRSAWAAIAIVATVHALQNLGPALLLINATRG